MAPPTHLPPPPGASEPARPTGDPLDTQFDRRLSELEMHRSIAVRDRLALARALEAEAVAAGHVEATMRARLVMADMLQRVGDTPTAVQMAADVHRWATGERAMQVLGRSHLVLSTMFEKVGEPRRSHAPASSPARSSWRRRQRVAVRR